MCWFCQLLSTHKCFSTLSKFQEKWRSFRYDDLDFHSLGLTDNGVDIDKVTGKEHGVRFFKAFIEDEWERACLEKRDASSQILLKRKYGKINLYDIETVGFKPHVIDNLTVEWVGKQDFKCWCVLVRRDERVTDENKNDYVPWKINSELHYAIRTFYRKNPSGSNRSPLIAAQCPCPCFLCASI